MDKTKSVTIDATNGTDTSSLRISQFTDNFDTVRFLIEPKLLDYTLMIVAEIEGSPVIYEQSDDLLYISEDESSGQMFLVWHPGREVTCADGLVVYQIVGHKTENGEIVSTWYSSEGRIIVTDSIDTTPYSASLIGSYPNLLTRLILETGAIRALADEIGSNKVDKVDGKGLSENDFTTAEKTKLSEIESGAQVNIIEKIKVDGEEIPVNKSEGAVDIILAGKVDKETYNAEKELTGADIENIKASLESLALSKVDKEPGYGLSQNNFSDNECMKLEDIEYGAQKNIKSDWNEQDETSDAFLKNKPDIVRCVRKDFPDLSDTSSTTFANSLLGEENGTTIYYGSKCGFDNYMIIVVKSEESDESYLQFGFTGSIESAGNNDVCALKYRYGVYESYEDPETGEMIDYLSWQPWSEFLTEETVKKALYPKPVGTVHNPLRKNTSYNFGEVSELNIKFPGKYASNDGDVIYITFSTGSDNPNIVIDLTHASDIDAEFAPDTGYEICAKHNGEIWIVGWSEYKK